MTLFYIIRAEVQREEALQNFIDAQETLEDYQRKAKDKARKVNIYHEDMIHYIIRYTLNLYQKSNTGIMLFVVREQ